MIRCSNIDPKDTENGDMISASKEKERLEKERLEKERLKCEERLKKERFDHKKEWAEQARRSDKLLDCTNQIFNI